jgi:hypothetical protein
VRRVHVKRVYADEEALTSATATMQHLSQNPSRMLTSEVIAAMTES